MLDHCTAFHHCHAYIIQHFQQVIKESIKLMKELADRVALFSIFGSHCCALLISLYMQAALRLIGESVKPCTPYQNNHHHPADGGNTSSSLNTQRIWNDIYQAMKHFAAFHFPCHTRLLLAQLLHRPHIHLS